jgi:hypothetical protein
MLAKAGIQEFYFWIPSGPEALWAGGLLEFTPLKNGAGMTGE